MQLPRRPHFEGTAVVLEIPECESQGGDWQCLRQLSKLCLDRLQPEVMTRQRILEAPAIGTVLAFNWSFDNHARRGLVWNIRDLKVQIAIEADDPGILQVRGCDVIESEFPPAARSSVRRIRARRPR